MMYPAYPHHSNPNHMNMDLSSPKPLYQPWPYAPYPVPHQYHGCCSHYAGGPYGFCPPYTHYPPPLPPSSFHPYGLYPPFPGAYTPYSIPPQHYSVEQPRYEYDKNNHATHHCCGCSHHEDDRRPRIEEEPKVDKKTSESSLIPLLLKDSPEYPIMWLPRDYAESKVKEKEKEREKYSHVPDSVKHHEPSKRGGNESHDYPIMWLPHGYTEPKAKEKEKEKYSDDDPVSVKHREPLKRVGNGEDGQGGDGNRFPFQIFWLPSKNDEVANKELSDEKTTKSNEGSGECETGNKHAVQKLKQECANKEETSSKHAVQKVIPVKQATTNEEKKKPKSIDTKVNSDSVEKTDNGCRASPKMSKLPPVCLRIDPLPRKKKSSRSPSPSDKGRSPVNSPKPSQQQAQVLKKSKEEQSEGDIKNVYAKRDNLGDNEPMAKGDKSEKGKIEEKNLSENANRVERDAHEANVPKVEGGESEEKKNILEDANKVERDNHEPRGKGDENEKVKKNLSEHEAALIIQSVYRGFEVRKSQPLKKLRQIYQVREEVCELRNRIKDLESSGCTDGKKQMIIGETIMSLLLKLDTIQGLHPFVREVRKSVAKELVGLQEKLDSLSFVKSATPTEGSPQRNMHAEDEAIHGENHQAQSQASSWENHATESQCDDDAEATGQMVKSTPVQDKASTESDAEMCENQKVELREGLDEPHKEKSNEAPTECDEATGMCEDLATDSQEGCGEQHAPTESAEAALGLCESREVESTKSQEGCVEQQAPRKSDEAALGACGNQKMESTESQEGCDEQQAPIKSDEAALASCENQEVESTESQEACNTVGEQQLESDKEKLDQECAKATESQGDCKTVQQESEKVKPPSESDEALGSCENLEVGATESQEGIGELQMEMGNEKLNQECNTLQLESGKEKLPTESDEGLESCENHEVGATESPEDISEPQMELEEKLDQECDDTLHDVNLNDNQLQKSVEREVHGEDSIQDSDVCQRHEADDTNPVVSCEHGDDKNALMDDVGMKSELPTASEVPAAEDHEGRLVEENEKLKVAVEELMKAGKEQLGVIRELTGRVKDLEKKLSKKKKIKVNKCRRSRGAGCVVQKD